MKLSKELIGQSFPIIKLPKNKKADLSIGQFYEVVEVKSRTLLIKDDSDNEISVYPSFMNFETSLADKDSKKKEFEDKNFGFDWVNDNLDIVLPEEYNQANDEDEIKEMGYMLKAEAFIKGAEMDEGQFELMVDYLKRKNKIKEYQDVMFEVRRREESRSNAIDELLS
jgi:hypothetical protein